jgi:hypothetical protein
MLNKEYVAQSLSKYKSSIKPNFFPKINITSFSTAATVAQSARWLGQEDGWLQSGLLEFYSLQVRRLLLSQICTPPPK